MVFPFFHVSWYLRIHTCFFSYSVNAPRSSVASSPRVWLYSAVRRPQWGVRVTLVISVCMCIVKYDSIHVWSFKYVYLFIYIYLSICLSYFILSHLLWFYVFFLSYRIVLYLLLSYLILSICLSIHLSILSYLFFLLSYLI